MSDFSTMNTEPSHARLFTTDMEVGETPSMSSVTPSHMPHESYPQTSMDMYSASRGTPSQSGFTSTTPASTTAGFGEMSSGAIQGTGSSMSVSRNDSVHPSASLGPTPGNMDSRLQGGFPNSSRPMLSRPQSCSATLGNHTTAPFPNTLVRKPNSFSTTALNSTSGEHGSSYHASYASNATTAPASQVSSVTPQHHTSRPLSLNHSKVLRGAMAMSNYGNDNYHGTPTSASTPSSYATGTSKMMPKTTPTVRPSPHANMGASRPTSSLNTFDVNAFQELASQTMHRLQGIWDDIGVTHEERGQIMMQLQTSLKDVYERAVHDHEMQKRQLEENIEKYQQQIHQWQSQLREQHIEIQRYPTLKETLQGMQMMMRDLEQKVHERRQKISECDERLHALCHELEIEKVLHFTGTDLSQQAIQNYHNTIQDAMNLQKQRMKTIEKLGTEVKALMKELCIPDDEIQACMIKKSLMEKQTIPASQSNIERLDAEKKKLLEIKEERTQQFAAYAREIKGLWNQLEVSERDRRSFIANNNKLGPENLQACAIELEKLRDSLHARMQDLCNAKRNTLEKLWNEAGVGKAERNQCEAYISGDANEEVLEALAHEIAEATRYVESIRPVLRSIQKWEIAWKRKVDFDIATNDPTRFMTRAPGRLLREEKERKDLAVCVPRAEKEVKTFLKRWESEFGRDFLYQGERYLDTIENMKIAEEERKLQEKERRAREKAQRSNGGSGAGTYGRTRAACRQASSRTSSKTMKTRSRATPKRNATSQRITSARSKTSSLVQKRRTGTRSHTSGSTLSSINPNVRR